MVITLDGIKWTVEQKENTIQFNLFHGDEKLVEALNVQPDDAEKFANALILAAEQAKRWKRINSPHGSLNF